MLQSHSNLKCKIRDIAEISTSVLHDDLLGAGPVTFCPPAGAVTLASPKTAPKQNKTKKNIIYFFCQSQKKRISTFDFCVPMELQASMRDS